MKTTNTWPNGCPSTRTVPSTSASVTDRPQPASKLAASRAATIPSGAECGGGPSVGRCRNSIDTVRALELRVGNDFMAGACAERHEDRLRNVFAHAAGGAVD